MGIEPLSHVGQVPQGDSVPDGIGRAAGLGPTLSRRRPEVATKRLAAEYGRTVESCFVEAPGRQDSDVGLSRASQDVCEGSRARKTPHRSNVDNSRDGLDVSFQYGVAGNGAHEGVANQPLLFHPAFGFSNCEESSFEQPVVYGFDCD